jgi:hypothetical protein
MKDQDLAYEAVIELLAHQFAYPVKWYVGVERAGRRITVNTDSAD